MHYARFLAVIGLLAGLMSTLYIQGDVGYSYEPIKCYKPCHPGSFGDWPTGECDDDYND